jgi:hypothetical protein
MTDLEQGNDHLVICHLVRVAAGLLRMSLKRISKRSARDRTKTNQLKPGR